MTGMVQTDLGPLAVSKYKEEPVDDSVSIRSISYLSAFYFHLGYVMSLSILVVGPRLSLRYPASIRVID